MRTRYVRSQLIVLQAMAATIWIGAGRIGLAESIGTAHQIEPQSADECRIETVHRLYKYKDRLDLAINVVDADLEPFRRHLASPSPTVRAIAAFLLWDEYDDGKPEEVVRTLVGVLTSVPEFLKDEHGRAYGSWSRAVGALRMMNVPEVDAAIDRVSEILKTEDERDVLEAIRFLASRRTRARSAVPALVALLEEDRTSDSDKRRQEQSGTVAEHAAEAILEIGIDSPEQVASLRNHPNPGVRAIAVKLIAVCNMAEKSSKPLDSSGLSTPPHTTVREPSSRASEGGLPDSATIPTDVLATLDSEFSFLRRHAVVTILARDISHEKARKVLLKELAAPRTGSSFPERAGQLFHERPEEVRKIIDEVIAKAGMEINALEVADFMKACAPQTVPQILEFLDRAENGRERWSLVGLLWEIGPEASASLDKLQQLRTDLDPRVRAEARDAIRAIEGRE